MRAGDIGIVEKELVAIVKTGSFTEALYQVTDRV
jgi:hypothetical protein